LNKKERVDWKRKTFKDGYGLFPIVFRFAGTKKSGLGIRKLPQTCQPAKRTPLISHRKEGEIRKSYEEGPYGRGAPRSQPHSFVRPVQEGREYSEGGGGGEEKDILRSPRCVLWNGIETFRDEKERETTLRRRKRIWRSSNERFPKSISPVERMEKKSG